MSRTSMDEAQKKAHVLIEALPYIQKFNRKIIVVKYGGSAMTDDSLLQSVIQDVTLLKLVGFKPIIVHGGGKAISRWLKKIGKDPQFIDGLRVTDAETMEVAEMVLSRVSKDLVARVSALGIKSIGISGKDGDMLQVKKRISEGGDIGYVGEITHVNPSILTDLLEDDFLPIVAPVGLDSSYDTYNINADDAACAIAKAVGADKLVYLSDVEGLYRDINDASTFISRINIAEAENLISSGEITGGMIPKLSNCIEAVRGGVRKVHILDGRTRHCLLLEIFTKHGVGTVFFE